MMFDNINQHALTLAKGRRSEADYLLDKPYWEFYYNAMQANKYNEMVAEDIKKARNKSKTSKT